jgi:hypothetical protein
MSKSEKLNNVTIIVTNARLSFPHLVEAKSTNNGVPRFQASFLMDPKDPEQKEQIKKIKETVEQIAMENFGKKVPSDKCCLRKGDDEEGNPRYDGYGGMWAVSAARAQKQGRPALVDRRRNPLSDKDAATMLYAGCRVNAKINIYANNHEGVKRINATIEVVQFVCDDEPFGAGPASVDDMPELTDDLDDADGLDDAPAKGKAKAKPADDDDDI